MKTVEKTTAGALIKKSYDKIREELKRNLIEGNIPAINKDISFYAIVDPKHPLTSAIPPFHHPIKVDDSWVIDLRSYHTKIDYTDVEVKIPNNDTVLQIIYNAVLSMVWHDHPDEFERMGVFPMQAYAEWLGNLISDSLGLSNPGERIQIKAALMHWAWVQRNIRTDDSSYMLSEYETETCVNLLVRSLNIERSIAKDIVYIFDNVTDISDFCLKLRKLEIRKLYNFNPKIMYQLTGTSWFGLSDTKNMLYVAIEFPPYFYTLVYLALGNKRYKKASIATNIDRMVKTNRRLKDPIRKFNHSFGTLVTDFLGVDDVL